MPLYFCTKCHELTQREWPANPNTFVCDECKEGKPITDKETTEKSDKKERICCSLADAIADWK